MDDDELSRTRRKDLSTGRTVIYGLASVAFGLLIALALAEILFRLLPTTDILLMSPVSKQAPYRHFQPDTTAQISIGKFFDINHRKEINNYGFFSDFDYRRDDPRPTLTLIGDSYVEGLQVPNSRSVQGVLQDELQDRYQVVAMGTSGSPLSQYLAYARFAQAEFDPETLVFIIIGNDYDESSLEYKSAPSYHYINTELDHPELQLIEWAPSWKGRLAVKSATFRYLFGNLKLHTLSLNAFFGDADKEEERRYIGSTSISSDPDRIRHSRIAVDYFVSEVGRLADGKRVIIVMDGIREAIYDPDLMPLARSSFLYEMNRYMAEASEAAGFRVVDLHPVFARIHAEDQTRFEFEFDWHWNENGHRVAAEQILAALDGPSPH